MMMNIVRRQTALGTTFQKLESASRLYDEAKNAISLLERQLARQSEDNSILLQQLKDVKEMCKREVELRTEAEKEKDYLEEYGESLEMELVRLRVLLEEALAKEQGGIGFSKDPVGGITPQKRLQELVQ